MAASLPCGGESRCLLSKIACLPGSFNLTSVSARTLPTDLSDSDPCRRFRLTAFFPSFWKRRRLVWIMANPWGKASARSEEVRSDSLGASSLGSLGPRQFGLTIILIGISTLILSTCGHRREAQQLHEEFGTRSLHPLEECWPWGRTSWPRSGGLYAFRQVSRGAHFDFLQPRRSIRKTSSVKCFIYRGAMVTNL